MRHDMETLFGAFAIPPPRERERPPDTHPFHQMEWAFDSIAWAYSAGHASITFFGRFCTLVENAILAAGFGVEFEPVPVRDVGTAIETRVVFMRSDHWEDVDYARYNAAWWEDRRDPPAPASSAVSTPTPDDTRNQVEGAVN